jgi:prepilin-type N-terminal cleavage/methylation domain-containing protein
MHMQRPTRRPSSQAGFTLLEVLIASSIFLLVMYAVYTVYDVGEASYTKGSRKWDVQTQARVALERMAREIRSAGYASTKLSDPVVIATNDTLSFHADLDGTGPKYITYSRRDCSGNIGTTLYRKESAGTLSTAEFCGGDVFAENVSALTFTYYEMNNVPLPYPLTATYQLDGQAHVTGTSTPSVPVVGGQRNLVRQVKIEITIQQTMKGQTLPFTATTDVALRNLI